MSIKKKSYALFAIIQYMSDSNYRAIIGGCFYFGGNMKYKPKVIICPQCLRQVGTYDGRSTINKSVRCKNCKKLVVYDIKSGKCELKPIPERMQGSGMRFY